MFQKKLIADWKTEEEIAHVHGWDRGANAERINMPPDGFCKPDDNIREAEE